MGMLVAILFTVLLPATLLAAGAYFAPPAAAAPWDDAAPFPSYFDLRDRGQVSAVRKQNGHSTCWIMSAVGSLESCLLPGAKYDFSENHLANKQSSRLLYEGRANSRLSAAYFARWEGPVLERDDPYPRPGSSPEGLRAVRHVQHVLFLPRRQGPRDNAAVKWALMNHGAVDAGMAYERASMNYSTYAYNTRSTDLDHHVCIVGWDDHYPASRFKLRPPGDGAFLIKNSWGTDWGLKGYFWISYYDATLGRRLAVFTRAESRTNYDAIYQYDALGWTRSIGFRSTSAWFANRFTCAGSGTVAAVSFYASVPDSAYEVRVAPALSELEAAPVAAAGTLGVGGYRTVRLTEPVPVEAGQEFVVAVRLTTPGDERPIPVEHPSSLVAPRAARGQSYVSRDGAQWTDLTRRDGFGRSNVCLKAFVTAADGGDTAAPRVRVADTEVRSGATARVRYTLGDPEFSCASAAVRIVVRNASGRLLRRVRIPAVAVGERGVWRFTCRLRPGTYRLEARAWDVAGNRQRSLSRATLRVKDGGRATVAFAGLRRPSS